MNFRNPAANRIRALQLFLLVLLVSLGAQAQKVHVSYDKSLDFSKFKTYAWAPHGAVAHPMLAADVVGAIEDEMKAKGLQLTADNPDLVIQVYGSIDQDTSMASNDPLYMATGGIPPFDPSAFGPALSGTWGNTTVTIHKGQLVVDLLDVTAKRLVWRGMATDNLSANNPEKLESQVNNSIAKMFKQYPTAKG
ncbi:MAG: DUF4136 domain-containing protein [Candidatus Korobacteraceae bacterium]